MIRATSLLIGLGLAAAATAQQAPAPATPPAAKPAPARPDATDPRMRDMPVRCRPGDVDVAGGRTLGAIFGADWPAAPDVPAARRTAAQAVTLGRVDWPADGGPATAVSAVLVDAQGKPLRAQVLCASKTELAAPVQAASMRGTYRAATFDGTPATGVAIVTWRVGAPRAGR